MATSDINFHDPEELKRLAESAAMDVRICDRLLHELGGILSNAHVHRNTMDDALGPRLPHHPAASTRPNHTEAILEAASFGTRFQQIEQIVKRAREFAAKLPQIPEGERR